MESRVAQAVCWLIWVVALVLVIAPVHRTFSILGSRVLHPQTAAGLALSAVIVVLAVGAGFLSAVLRRRFLEVGGRGRTAPGGALLVVTLLSALAAYVVARVGYVVGARLGNQWLAYLLAIIAIGMLLYHMPKGKQGSLGDSTATEDGGPAA